MDIIKILLSYQAIMIYELIMIITLFVLYIKTKKKNKKYKAMKSQQKNFYREKELDEKLVNEFYVDKHPDERARKVPYEVKYHEEKAVYLKDVIGIAIEEEGNLTTKKYVINLLDVAFAGKDDNNDIVINDEMMGKRQLKFINNNKCPYVQTMDKNCAVILKRKKKKFQLGEDAVKLVNGDELEISDTVLKITIIEE